MEQEWKIYVFSGGTFDVQVFLRVNADDFCGPLLSRYGMVCRDKKWR